MCVKLFLGAVGFLMLARYAGEQDQKRAVGLEALDVCGEGGGGEVGAAMVDRYADCGSEFAGDASFLPFPKPVCQMCLKKVLGLEEVMSV